MSSLFFGFSPYCADWRCQRSKSRTVRSFGSAFPNEGHLNT
jgi:hypothetical protein